MLTDNDNSRTITAVEHYEGSGAAILTLSSVLDRDSDIGVDTVSAKAYEIFNRSNDRMRTIPVAMIGNECPPGGFLINFDSESPGSTTVTDTTGLVVGDVTSGDPAFGILGDGYFTGDPIQQVPTYIDFNQNTRCFKTPRAYTLETRVYFDTVDMDYGDVYPLNGLDDDWDGGDPDSSDNMQTPLHFELPDTDPLTPDGRKMTTISLFNRKDLIINFKTSRANYTLDGTEERKDKTTVALRHRTQNRKFCDGTRPNDPRVFAATLSEEAGSERGIYDIVSGHWYTIRLVFNTDKANSSFDFFARDEGTDGNGTGAIWSGYVNIGKSSLLSQHDCSYTTNMGSELSGVDATFSIGGFDDVPGHVYTPWLPGKMDWLSFKPIADYTGVQDGPYVGNTDPIAAAGTDQNVDTNTLVTLDGSGSTDGDGDAFTFFWEIIAEPGGSTASISGNGTDSPTFTPNVDGIYTIQLTVTDDYGGSSSDTVDVIASTP